MKFDMGVRKRKGRLPVHSAADGTVAIRPAHCSGPLWIALAVVAAYLVAKYEDELVHYAQFL